MATVAVKKLTEQIRFEDTTPINDSLNKLVQLIDVRLAALDVLKTTVDDTIDNLTEVALSRMDDVFTPLIEDAQQRLANFGANFSAHSTTSNTIGLGPKTFYIDPAQKDGYVFGDYVAARPAGSTTSYVICSVQGYDRATGALSCTCEKFSGTGTFVSWDLRLAAAPDLTHETDFNNPHHVTAAQVGAYTIAAADAAIVANGTSVQNAVTSAFQAGDAALHSTISGEWGAADTANLGTVNTALAVRLRVDTGQGLTAAQQAQAAANLGVVPRVDAVQAFTTAQKNLARNNVGASPASALKQGRLTFVSGTPVMTATVIDAPSVLWTPYEGKYIPIFDGADFVAMDTGGELVQAKTDATKSPAAVVAGQQYDVFGWLDGTTPRATRGPAWQTTLSRGIGAGTSQLVRVNGFFLNAVDIANGPLAQRGTYLGTFMSASGNNNLSWVQPSLIAGGGASWFALWNFFNRRRIGGSVFTATDTWIAPAATIWGRVEGTLGWRHTWVTGVVEEQVRIDASCYINNTQVGGASYAAIGMSINDDTAPSGGAIGAVALGAIGQTETGVVSTGRLGFNWSQLFALGQANPPILFLNAGPVATFGLDMMA
jgi:hypothetical protein